MRVTAKRCPSCGKLVPISDMVGADEQTQRCSACDAKAMVARSNRLHDMHLQSIAGMPHGRLVHDGERRTTTYRRANWREQVAAHVRGDAMRGLPAVARGLYPQGHF